MVGFNGLIIQYHVSVKQLLSCQEPVINLDAYLFEPADKQVLLALLGDQSTSLDIDRLWALKDQVWDESGCDSAQFDDKAYSKFYSHPVWLLNGIFIEQDDVSMRHRRAISDAVSALKPSSIVDFGGGFGTLARLLAVSNPSACVDICEPYPPVHGLVEAGRHSNIHYVSILQLSFYDVLVCTDVLEHVFDPLRLLADFRSALRPHGRLFIANCFYPVNKCHLPSTFHLRYTFDFFALLLGLSVVGDCVGSHARIYRLAGRQPLPWPVIRFFERMSQFVFPLLLLVRNCIFMIRSSFRVHIKYP